MNINMYKTVFLICLFYQFGLGYGKIPRVRLCGDKECKEIISMCKTTVNYNAGDKDMVSFRGNTPCRVMSKSVGEDANLWEIEVQGRRGYAPKSMIMEQRILRKAANLIEIVTDTETENSISENSSSEGSPNVENNTDTQSIVDSESKPSTDDGSNEKYDDVSATDESNPVLIPVEEPLAQKIDMYKTGVEDSEEIEVDDIDMLEDDDGNAIGTLNLVNVTNDVETSLKQGDDVQPSQIPASTEVPESESKKFETPNIPMDIFIPFANTDDITAMTEQMNSDSTPSNSLEQTNTDPEEKVSNEQEFTTNLPELSKTVADNEMTTETNPNTITNTINTENNFNTEQQKGITSEFENFTTYTTVPPTSSTDDEQTGTDVSKEIEEPHEQPSDNSGEQITSSTEDQQINVQVSQEEDVSKEIQEALDKAADHSNEQFASITDEKHMNMHVHHEEVVEEIEEPFEKPLDQLKELASITDDQHSNVSQEVVNEQLAEPLEISSDNSEEQIISQTNDAQINAHVSYGGATDEIEKPLDKPADNVENIFSDHSKEHIPDIFHSHGEQQNNEKSWYDTISDSLYEFSLFAQSLFTSYINKNNEHSSEQCKSQIVDGEQVNDEFCYKNDAPTKMHDNDYVEYVYSFTSELLANGDLKILLLLEVVAILIFIFGHYFLVNRRTENALVSKLNATERRLFASEKECTIAKSEVFEKRKVLDGIADKSFGTDDMIKQLEAEKAEMKEQIYALEKELETAAEAGLELNKMVAELLSSNQNGSDTLINSVEELQQQLNDQEATSIYINNLLAEKSRENSELRVQLSETNKMFGNKIDELMHENKLLCEEKEANEIEIQAYKLNIDEKLMEISQLKEDYELLERKYDDVLSKWQSSAAQAEAMKEAISQIENASIDDIKSIQDIANVNAKYLAAEKGNEFLKESLANETELRKRIQSQITDMNNEIIRLRSIANQNEKEKLEAQTRLEVLSSYFKEKETQLQSELDIKEALVKKTAGETTTTQLQDEIQGLRAQNEQLRAEIEAQSAAHKAQINTVEMRAHDSWLAAKQAERRLEEAKSEAAVLRKKLTSLTQQFSGAAGNLSLDGQTNDFNVPSPPNVPSPMMNLPPPPLVPFLPPPPLPLNEIRPAPLGRLMSPPPDRFRYDELNDTENDFSPPRSPAGSQSYKYAYKSKGSSSGRESDDWDRQTF